LNAAALKLTAQYQQLYSDKCTSNDHPWLLFYKLQATFVKTHTHNGTTVKTRHKKCTTYSMDYDCENRKMFVLLRMKMQKETTAEFAAVSRLNMP